jgi:hypothetical protein
MAYDEELAARVRAILAYPPDIRERKMFGGLTFTQREGVISDPPKFTCDAV